LAIAAIGQSASLPLLGGCRLLLGMAQAGCYPALTKVTRTWFEPARRTVLQGWIATTSGRAGGAVAPIVLGTVLMGHFKLSWQLALGLLGVLGVLYGLLFWKAFPGAPAGPEGVDRGREGPGPGVPGPASAPTAFPVRRAGRNRSLWFFTLQQFLDAGSDVAFVSLIGTYFLRARGFDITKTGWLASLPLVGGAVGGIVGGWLNDRGIAWTGNRRWSRSGVGCVGKLIGGAMLALSVRQADGVTAAWFLLAAKFFSDWSQPTTWGTCTDLGGRFSATVFGIINTAGTLGGIVMPLVFGKVLDRFTTPTLTDWSPLFFLLTAMYLGSGLCWLLVDCTRTIDDEDEDAGTLEGRGKDATD
jgi:ACS family D-galactonate transporter-like MFS transporter